MCRYAGELPIVESGAPKFALFEIKAEWLYEVQCDTGIGTQADDVARVWGDFGLIEDQIQHFPCARTRSYMFDDTACRMPHPMADSQTNSLQVDFCGLSLATPIVLLSGCVGFGEEYTRVEGFSNSDVGAVVLKGTTLEPRLGNPPHRVFETPMGMLNAIGLQNPGVDKVVGEILPGLDFTETRFMANVCGSTIEDYAEVTRRFDDSPIDAIEINISCPNIKEGGVQFGNVPAMSARVVAACRAETKKPIITKLSPNQTDIRENARLCIEAGSDGLAVINTMMGMAIDIEKRTPIIGNVQGGLSGPAIKPIALLKVRQVYEVAKLHNVPIIGQGGITSANDAIEFMLAGATTVGIGTALFYEPLACKTINQGLLEYLQRHNMSSVSELIGALQV